MFQAQRGRLELREGAHGFREGNQFLSEPLWSWYHMHRVVLSFMKLYLEYEMHNEINAYDIDVMCNKVCDWYINEL